MTSTNSVSSLRQGDNETMVARVLRAAIFQGGFQGGVTPTSSVKWGVRVCKRSSRLFMWVNKTGEGRNSKTSCQTMSWAPHGIIGYMAADNNASSGQDELNTPYWNGEPTPNVLGHLIQQDKTAPNINCFMK